MNGLVVAFRVDASTGMGTGHVMRCLTLASVLQTHGAKCHFIVRAHAANLSDMILRQGFSLSELPAGVAGFQPLECASSPLPAHAAWLGVDWQVDAAQTSAALEGTRSDWLVVDHYGIDSRWETTLRRSHVEKLLVIDDLADRSHDCDLLLDQNLGRTAQDYAARVSAGCRIFCGPRYALLRPEFGAMRSYSLSRRANFELRTVLISMGGVDLPNATCRVIEALRHVPLPVGSSVVVVMGRQSPWLARVRKVAATIPWPIKVRVDVSDMAQLMADCDLAVGAGGGSAWERCCLGVPTLTIECAANQRVVVEALALAGAAITMSASAEVDSIRLGLETLIERRDLREALSRKSRELVDGLGARRVALAALAQTIEFRKTMIDDADVAHIWRDDPRTRKYFRNSGSVSRAAHDVWWQQALLDRSCHMLLAICGTLKVGILRFDQRADSAEVSIYLDPEFTGLGLGAAMLDRGKEWLKANEPEIGCLFAHVLPENLASASIFAAAGFSRVDGDLWSCGVGK